MFLVPSTNLIEILFSIVCFNLENFSQFSKLHHVCFGDIKTNVRHVGEKYKSHGRVGFLALYYSWQNLISYVVPYI